MKRNSVWGITLKAGTIQATQVFGSRKEAEDAIAKISHLSNGFEAVELGPVNSPELPDGWIPCAERMPPKGICVIVSLKGGDVQPGTWNWGDDVAAGDLKWFSYPPNIMFTALHIRSFSHWIPLPTPPTTEK